jgi:hypothetical protein
MHSACALHHGLKIVKLRLVGPLERNDAHGAEPGRRGRAGCAAGRAVVGGLSAATIATLFVLPSVLPWCKAAAIGVQRRLILTIRKAVTISLPMQRVECGRRI